MPIYEYRCEACGTQEERLESFSAPEVHECRGCGAAEGMKRQLSVAAFALSGGGWYANGYSGGAPKAEAPKVDSKSADKPASGGCCGGCACH